ncbi:MAG: DUF2388 domain-containing protein [Pseudomonadota bacterium]|nr:DUF2388 domain-containing protein [Pseudomonadota bacterium]
MSRLLHVAIVVFAIAQPVQASSFAGTTGGAASAGSSASSGSTSGKDKVVVRARDDAAAFVASDGRIRGARLEAALRHLREADGEARHASDLALARRILAD